MDADWTCALAQVVIRFFPFQHKPRPGVPGLVDGGLPEQADDKVVTHLS